MRLLLAEDERELSNALVAILEHSDYEVDAVYDGEKALEYALERDYDGILLDIMMPKKDGIEVLKEARRQGIETPILMLTAKAEIQDKLEGLENGADDYLTKPFAMAELLARIKIITKRKGEYTSPLLRFENVELNRSTYELSTETSSIRLGNKECKMMEILITAKRWVTPEEFMEKIWGYDTEVEKNIVWVYISYLRKKLDAINASVQVKVEKDTGYQLEKKDD